MKEIYKIEIYLLTTICLEFFNKNYVKFDYKFLNLNNFKLKK